MRSKKIKIPAIGEIPKSIINEVIEEMEKLATSDMGKIYELERLKDYDTWARDSKIPKLNFPSLWEVEIIPPFGGAMVRFVVHCKGARVSVYLDCHDRLGFYGSPYWEICPVNGDIERCYINETEALMGHIWNSIREQIGEQE